MKKNNNAKRVKKNNKKKKNRKSKENQNKKEEKDKEKLPFVISLVKNYLPYFRNKSDSSGTCGRKNWNVLLNHRNFTALESF